MYRGVLLLIKLHLNGLQWWHIEHVVTIVQGRLLVIEWRETVTIVVMKVWV